MPKVTTDRKSNHWLIEDEFFFFFFFFIISNQQIHVKKCKFPTQRELLFRVHINVHLFYSLLKDMIILRQLFKRHDNKGPEFQSPYNVL